MFLLLFGFSVLEISYKTENVKSQKNSVASFSLGTVPALAIIDLAQFCKTRPGNWMWNQTVCICPQGHEIIDRIKCEPSTKSNLNTDSNEQETNNPCKGMTLTEVTDEIDKLDRKANEINARYAGTGRELPTKAKKEKNDTDNKRSECKKFKRKIEQDKEKETQCKEDKKKITEAGFGKACVKFARGMDCVSAIEACAMCPEPDEDSDFNSSDCVMIHQKTKCPLLSGEELKLAKEKRDKFKEELEEQEEDVSELEKDIVEKQNELNTALSELEEDFTNTVAEFERETANAKEDLETELNENKSAIKNEVSKQIAQVQEVVDKSLEIAHSF
ncbi:MAG: hypothetical protein OXJ52_07215, partial [Oligoflexia bacterium]|nr:hypothetical protein [Oligoflexia bacterium]